MKEVKQRGGALLIVVIVVVIALIGVVGYIAWQNMSQQSSTSQSTNNNTNNTNKTDPYEGWLTYEGAAGDYSIKYPSDWVLDEETDSDGPYIRNMNQTESSSDYIELRVLSIEPNDPVFGDKTASEWYSQLGVEDTRKGPVEYDASNVKNINFSNLSGKSAKGVFTATSENIFVTHDDYLYEIIVYPYGASSDVTVDKIIDSFTFL